MKNLYAAGLGNSMHVGAEEVRKEASVTSMLAVIAGGMLLIYGIPALKRRRAPRPYRPDRYDALYEYRHHY